MKIFNMIDLSLYLGQNLGTHPEISTWHKCQSFRPSIRSKCKVRSLKSMRMNKNYWVEFHFLISVTSILFYICFLPTNIESPRQSKRILWRTISFGSSGLFQLLRISPYPKYCNKNNVIGIIAIQILIDNNLVFLSCRINLILI